MITVAGHVGLTPLGSGGVGDVYRAIRSATGDTVAVKVLRGEPDDDAARRRARREVDALSTLEGHPHVIGVIELVDTAHGPAIVMEHAPGGSVADLLVRRGTLSIGEVTLIGRHAATALRDAHDAGVVHGDVKPHNLLIDANGQVKLCDFGIATVAGDDEGGRRTDARSPRYASPEQLEDDSGLTPASDVYSLGATLAHLAHGEPPTLRQRLVAWTPPPGDDPELVALDEIIAACLAPDPARRPPASEVLDRLQVVDDTLVRRCTALPVEFESADAPVPDPIDAALARLGWTDRRRDDMSVPTEPDGRPAGVVRPQPPARGRPRWPYAAAVVALAAIAGVVLAWHRSGAPAVAPAAATAPAADPASSGTMSPSTTAAGVEPLTVDTVERPAGLPPLDPGATIWPFGPIGECLVHVNGLDTLMPVDCGLPHDLQRLAVGDLGDLGVSDPGDTAEARFPAAEVGAATATACREALAAVADASVDTTVTRLAVTRPSAGSWAGGDRSYQCLIGVPGRHLVGGVGRDR